VNEPKAATAATSTKASSSSRVNEPKAATAATSTKASRNRNTSVVNFKNGSAELVDINDLKISLILDKLKSNSNLEITVEGYASSEGDLEFNINLSQKRADKYASYLVSQGVPKSNIKSIGKGIDNPIASNDTEEGRAQNRRVEVIIK
jgi:outer membrane protein OmpA-like peptidoglycan-associated protein